jgi:hypothetical protein
MARRPGDVDHRTRRGADFGGSGDIHLAGFPLVSLQINQNQAELCDVVVLNY